MNYAYLNQTNQQKRGLLFTPLTFRNLSKTTSKVGFSYSIAPGKGMYFRKNNNTPFEIWDGAEIELQEGEIVEFAGSGLFPTTSQFHFTTNGKIAVLGNIMSLLNKDNFAEIEEVPDNYFAYLFYNINSTSGNNGLYDVSELLLPAKKVGKEGYNMMFYSTPIRKAPRTIDAEIIGDNAFRSMFNNCRFLQTAPNLRFITMGQYACSSMFNGCVSLTIPPELYAESLNTACYESMFYGCSALKKTPILPAKKLAENCYLRMFYGCINLKTAILPAQQLAAGCYQYMFQDCIGINKIDVNFSSFDGFGTTTYPTSDWLRGTSAESSVFRCPQALADATTTRSASTIPEGWTIETF